jgi:hypothetical protein
MFLLIIIRVFVVCECVSVRVGACRKSDAAEEKGRSEDRESATTKK